MSTQQGHGRIIFVRDFKHLNIEKFYRSIYSNMGGTTVTFVGTIDFWGLGYIVTSCRTVWLRLYKVCYIHTQYGVYPKPLCCIVYRSIWLWSPFFQHCSKLSLLINVSMRICSRAFRTPQLCSHLSKPDLCPGDVNYDILSVGKCFFYVFSHGYVTERHCVQ